MKGLWFRVQGLEFQGFRVRRQSAMVPIVYGLIATTSALLYGSVSWTKVFKMKGFLVLVVILE